MPSSIHRKPTIVTDNDELVFAQEPGLRHERERGDDGINGWVTRGRNSTVTHTADIAAEDGEKVVRGITAALFNQEYACGSERFGRPKLPGIVLGLPRRVSKNKGDQGGDDLRAAAPSLSPVLTGRGLVDLVESPQDITGRLLFAFV